MLKICMLIHTSVKLVTGRPEKLAAMTAILIHTSVKLVTWHGSTNATTATRF